MVTGGRIFTTNPDQPWAEALLVEGDRITRVGGDELIAEYANKDIDHLDIAGGLVVPGFVDGHVHVGLTGSSMLKAQLQGAGSLEEIQRRVLKWAQANPEAPRVLGTNWVHADIPAATPTREMLDDIVADRPVYLEAFDFHSSWVNTAALAELGITRDTPDPIGGRIVRDLVTGEATGHLLENASVNYVWSLLNKMEPEVQDQHISIALEAFTRAGITGVVEMALEEAALESMARLKSRGELKVRIVAHMIVWRTGNPAEELAIVKRAIELADQYQGDSLRVGGIKIIADGTIDNCTAGLSKPYSNGETSGPIWDAEALNPVVAAADAANLQVAVHAIGDATITLAVDAIENAMRINGSSEPRHRLSRSGRRNSTKATRGRISRSGTRLSLSDVSTLQRKNSCVRSILTRTSPPPMAISASPCHTTADRTRRSLIASRRFA
jgi:predicted amidohydrolase YtcJ